MFLIGLLYYTAAATMWFKYAVLYSGYPDNAKIKALISCYNKVCVGIGDKVKNILITIIHVL